MSSCELTRNEVQRSPSPMRGSANPCCYEKSMHVETPAAKQVHVQTRILEMLAVINMHSDVSYL